MVAFAFSCVAILLFLWLSFGGPVPLRSESYRFEVSVPEATSLATESDVRISGRERGQGQVQAPGQGRRPDPARGGDRAALRAAAARQPGDPAPEDPARRDLPGAHAGRPVGGELADGGRLPDAQVQPTVELDEIFGVFSPRTRRAFQRSSAELAKAFSGRRGQALNDAIGNLEGAATSGERLLSVLRDQRTDLRGLVRNGSVVLGALNDRRGALAG